MDLFSLYILSLEQLRQYENLNMKDIENKLNRDINSVTDRSTARQQVYLYLQEQKRL